MVVDFWSMRLSKFTKLSQIYIKMKNNQGINC